jgi:hypothetical protein
MCDEYHIDFFKSMRYSRIEVKIMTNIRENCPICNGPLAIVQVVCQQCHSRIEAEAAVLVEPATPERESEFARYGSLARLSREQLAFVETFIRARGIIKTVEGMLGISYPTVRSRLEDILVTMGLSPRDESASGEARREQRDIAAELAEGKITPQQAHELLRRLAQGIHD